MKTIPGCVCFFVCVPECLGYENHFPWAFRLGSPRKAFRWNRRPIGYHGRGLVNPRTVQISFFQQFQIPTRHGIARSADSAVVAGTVVVVGADWWRGRRRQQGCFQKRSHGRGCHDGRPHHCCARWSGAEIVGILTATIVLALSSRITTGLLINHRIVVVIIVVAILAVGRTMVAVPAKSRQDRHFRAQQHIPNKGFDRGCGRRWCSHGVAGVGYCCCFGDLFLSFCYVVW